MTPIRLAIVGGGPKAAALCAKIACLRDLFRVPIEATVFERSTPGAHWSGGESGYTDGVQCLCTPAERDLGFPYSDAFGEPGKIAERMLAEYSWAAYLKRERLAPTVEAVVVPERDRPARRNIGVQAVPVGTLVSF